ncbi:MAG: RNA methyltransferase [Ilumatobacter sp.]|nr:MAG: RNA methyltransferase [Ilumatobacter sp.]
MASVDMASVDMASVDMLTVDDPADPRLDLFRRNDRGLAGRADRRDDAGAGHFLAEGDLVVERALDAGCTAVAALVDPDRVPDVAHRLDAVVYTAGPEVRRAVTGLGMLHPVVAVFERPARRSAADLVAGCDRLVVLEGVDNPANVGAIVRNAAALGWDGLLLDHTSSDPLARRALRVAMGTAFTLPHARTSDLAGALTDASDMDLIALTPAADATDLAELRIAERRALLIGSERAGLSAELLTIATHCARIPMAGGVDSLNAAAASAIACYALRR